jgi:hypothetical protein
MRFSRKDAKTQRIFNNKNLAIFTPWQEIYSFNRVYMTENEIAQQIVD